MWTYSPQKRQVGSAFALTYRFFLRSCKLPGAFIIHPCLPFCQNHCKQQGPFAPRTLLRFIARIGPSDSLSPSTDFPVSPVIRFPFPPLSRRAKWVSPVAPCALVIVLSL